MAKVIIPDKICPHCGGNEWYVNFENITKRTRYACAKLRKENSILQRINNREEINKRNRDWRSKNKDKIKKRIRKKYPSLRKTVDIPEKICPECNGIKWQITTNLTTGFISYRCAHKLKNSTKKYYESHSNIWKTENYINKSILWRKTHPEKAKEYQLTYYDRNKEIRILQSKQWIIDNPDKVKKRAKQRHIKSVRKRYNRNRVKSMTNSYIIWAIIAAAKGNGINITPDQITQEDIDLQREATIAKRSFKQYKQSLKT